MSELIFDGATHQILLVDSNGKTIDTWAAYNNVDSHATLSHLQNKSYTVQDKSIPHRHLANSNGPYGSYGIIRFHVAGHPGIGIHSGRASVKVKNNTGGSARLATSRNRHKNLRELQKV